MLEKLQYGGAPKVFPLQLEQDPVQAFTPLIAAASTPYADTGDNYIKRLEIQMRKKQLEHQDKELELREKSLEYGVEQDKIRNDIAQQNLELSREQFDQNKINHAITTSNIIEDKMLGAVTVADYAKLQKLYEKHGYNPGDGLGKEGVKKLVETYGKISSDPEFRELQRRKMYRDQQTTQSMSGKLSDAEMYYSNYVDHIKSVDEYDKGLRKDIVPFTVDGTKIAEMKNAESQAKVQKLEAETSLLKLKAQEDKLTAEYVKAIESNDLPTANKKLESIKALREAQGKLGRTTDQTINSPWEAASKLHNGDPVKTQAQVAEWEAASAKAKEQKEIESKYGPKVSKIVNGRVEDAIVPGFDWSTDAPDVKEGVGKVNPRKVVLQYFNDRPLTVTIPGADPNPNLKGLNQVTTTSSDVMFIPSGGVTEHEGRTIVRGKTYQIIPKNDFEKGIDPGTLWFGLGTNKSYKDFGWKKVNNVDAVKELASGFKFSGTAATLEDKDLIIIENDNTQVTYETPKREAPKANIGTTGLPPLNVASRDSVQQWRAYNNPRGLDFATMFKGKIDYSDPNAKSAVEGGYLSEKAGNALLELQAITKSDKIRLTDFDHHISRLNQKPHNFDVGKNPQKGDPGDKMFNYSNGQISSVKPEIAEWMKKHGYALVIEDDAYTPSPNLDYNNLAAGNIYFNKEQGKTPQGKGPHYSFEYVGPKKFDPLNIN